MVTGKGRTVARILKIATRMYGSIWTCMDPYGPPWSSLVPYGPVLPSMVPYSPVWSCMDLYSPMCSPTVQFGPILSRIVSYGPIWTHMVLYGPIYGRFFPVTKFVCCRMRFCWFCNRCHFYAVIKKLWTFFAYYLVVEALRYQIWVQKSQIC